MTPLETCRAKMQKIYGQMADLAVRGRSDPAEAKEETQALLDKLAPLFIEQDRLMDLSGDLARFHASEFGGGGAGHVRLRAFKNPADAYAAGQWARWRLLKDEGAAAWCAGHPELLASMSESVNTAGGFLVPDVLGTTIIDLREQYGVARRECEVVPMSSDQQHVPKRTSGVTAYYTKEGAEIAASDVGWGLVSLGAKKLAALTRISTEVSEDAVISLAEHVADEIAWAFAQAEDDALFNGDGTLPFGGMYGILPKLIDGTHTAGAVDVTTATHNLFTEIDAADLQGLVAALPEYAEKNAKWYCSGRAWGLVFARLLMAAAGNSMVDLSAGLKRSYLGYEVVTSPKMPAGAATDYDAKAMILFGDMRKAVMLGNRRDTMLKVDASRYLEYDQVAVMGTERYDINVHSLGDNTDAGPLVGLIGSSA